MSTNAKQDAAPTLAHLLKSAMQTQRFIREVIGATAQDITKVAGMTQSVEVPFAQNGWTKVSDGVYTITIKQTAHKRQSAAYIAQIRHTVAGVQKEDTWAVVATRTAYNAETGDITLTTNAPFDGTVTFLG